ncbi:unnamed protein product [Hermetia illucens]|uniref:AAA+ ATPase domain-containing protein n=1 Tax=Hermetia illucens TaxID=343691 RepID=A0A7R8YUA5_HERIL|nr:pachytene checkpoint protein 2 homolog isoform X2 [Hermetia illucens]CAD7082574.1 unnamed protein product [Hermetia illucens]
MGDKKAMKCHVEVAVLKKNVDLQKIQSFVERFVTSGVKLKSNAIIQKPDGLEDCVEFIQFDDNIKYFKSLNETQLVYHFYKINERGAEIEILESDSNESNDEVPASNHWLLPSRDFTGLWESLIYEEGLKENILKYVETSLLFSQRKVNPNIISCNRIILLHGPPGTGKTSLCKAVAQKLSIRMSQNFKYTHLVEINSHSLFSKWFSESGKLVMKLFSRIREIVEHPQSLVCVLIDEVESIAYARSSVSGDEPRDALRVVNAVLTQLDQIRKYPNVLILTTSNLTATIDCAFIDRADIKIFIDFPTTRAIYEIYLSAIHELMRVQIIQNQSILVYDSLDNFERIDDISDCTEHELSMKLLKIAEQSIGLSGRTLRKIPFLAHSLLVENDVIVLNDFLNALKLSLQNHLKDTKALSTGTQVNGYL